ncbi:MAG: glycosyltransferase family 4 protein [Herpetosiphon sp.]
MRIALISAEYPPTIGGMGDYTYHLAVELLQRGHHAMVITGGRAPSAESRSVPSLSLPITWRWNALPRLLAALHALCPDVVHLQYQAGAYGQHPAITLLPALISRRLKLPVVVTPHDLLLPYLFPKADPVRRIVMRTMLTAADAVIVTNTADLARLTGRHVADRRHYTAHLAHLHLIPIGSNIPVAPPVGYERAAWRAAAGLADAEVVAYFGLVGPSKGLLPLVESLPLLPPNVRLLIIGGAAPGPADQAYAACVDHCIEHLALNDRILRTGPCSPAEVSAWLLASDVVALPFLDGASYRRGSLLAALAHGLPVVTTPPEATLVPELNDRAAVYFVPQPEKRALAGALRAVLADPVLRERLSKGARLLSQHWSWPAIAAHHEAVYNALRPEIGADPFTGLQRPG